MLAYFNEVHDPLLVLQRPLPLPYLLPRSLMYLQAWIIFHREAQRYDKQTTLGGGLCVENSEHARPDCFS